MILWFMKTNNNISKRIYNRSQDVTLYDYISIYIDIDIYTHNMDNYNDNKLLHNVKC